MINSKRISIGADIICIALCIILLLPLFAVGVYNRPAADDYSNSVVTHEAVVADAGILDILSAAWENAVSVYNTWQGTYSSAFLFALHPGIWGEIHYAWTTVIITLLCYTFLFLSINILNSMFLKKNHLSVISLSLVLFTTLMLWLPSPAEGLYWFNGSIHYMPWAFLSIFSFCWLIKLGDTQKTGKHTTAIVVNALLSFLISGGNQVTAFENILLLLILTVFFVWKKKYHTILPLALACLGFIVMYLAPGMQIRASELKQQTVIGTITAVIPKLRIFASRWINLQWLLSLVAITPCGLEIAKRWKESLPKYAFVISLLLTTMVICGMLSVPYYAMGGFGPPRLTNIVWIAFMFFSWLNYVVLLTALVKEGILCPQKILSPKSRSFAAIAVCLALGLSFVSQGSSGASSSAKAARELIQGIPQSYAVEMDARLALFNDKSLVEVCVPPLKNKSELLLYCDLSTDPDMWINRAVGEYYHKTIYLEKTSYSE